ncbi:MAG: ribbon-helix-helix protein, CopG family [Aeromicrobium sp.]|jgi:metal-responsive CopG/Arc/MetJ family transcriptional regulator|nr:ribbon-helix-helix protein, CopG family [Aeromicrobium sp.]
MAKPTISIPDGMLEDIDRRAAEAGISRSAFVQEAIARYGEALDEQTAQEARARRIHRAIEEMREIGKKMPPGVDGTAIIRRLRDAPPRWLEPEDER